MSEPERSAERDQAIDRLLDMVPFPGWSMMALRRAAGPDADLLFPQGPVDMVEAYCDLADRRMAEDSPPEGRVPDRVRAIIVRRLAQNRPFKPAIRQALALIAARPATASACTVRTVDTIWHAAGDRSADFSWYTKRAILIGVYTTTLLFWLQDDSDADGETLAFLDRRLAEVGRIGKLRRRIESAMSRSLK